MSKKTNKERIEILKEAKKLVIEGYGKKCTDFDFRCFACVSGIVVDFLDEYIGDIKTEMEVSNMSKKWESDRKTFLKKVKKNG